MAEKRKQVIKITTGSKALDTLIGGGIESMRSARQNENRRKTVLHGLKRAALEKRAVSSCLAGILSSDHRLATFFHALSILAASRKCSASFARARHSQSHSYMRVAPQQVAMLPRASGRIDSLSSAPLTFLASCILTS